MAILTVFCRPWSFGKVSAPMNRLIVKPIPQSSAIPNTCNRVDPTGKLAKPARVTKSTLPNTPRSFPKNRPSTTPSASRFVRISGVRPATETPALAKPKIGMIRKTTHFWSPCSKRCNGELVVEFRVTSCGMQGNRECKHDPRNSGVNT